MPGAGGRRESVARRASIAMRDDIILFGNGALPSTAGPAAGQQPSEALGPMGVARRRVSMQVHDETVNVTQMDRAGVPTGTGRPLVRSNTDSLEAPGHLLAAGHTPRSSIFTSATSKRMPLLSRNE